MTRLAAVALIALALMGCSDAPTSPDPTYRPTCLAWGKSDTTYQQGLTVIVTRCLILGR